MEGRASKYCHVFPSWKMYPRTDYLQRRYKCLMQRLPRVMENLPTGCQNQDLTSNLKNFNDLLDRKPRIIVYGKEDIDVEQMVVDPEQMHALSEELSDTEGVKIVVCHVDVFGVEHNDIKEAKAEITYACTGENVQNNVFVVCDVHGSFTDQQLEYWHGNIFKHIQSQIKDWKHSDRIIIGSGSGLHTKMNEFFENLITENMLMLNEYTQQCHIPTEVVQIHQRNKNVNEKNDFGKYELNVLETDIVVKTMLCFLRKTFSGDCLEENFIDKFLTDLARAVRCAVLHPLKDRYDIPTWICNVALHDIDFEENLCQSVSRNSKYHIKKLQPMSGNRMRPSRFDFLLYPLQAEMAVPVKYVEDKIAVIRKGLVNATKLNCEIGGYLRQAVGNNVSAKVRYNENIKRRFSEFEDKFENGNTIYSRGRLGTLGCFVSSNNNALYVLTCAHVVLGETHYICAQNKNGEPKRFAVTTPEMTLVSGNCSLPLVDIAAVKVCDQLRGMCDQCLKDDDGERKEAKLSSDAPVDLTGCFVHQYGATSGLKKGIIMPNNCSIFGDNANEYILNVECLAGAENEQFAQPGDSGAVICMTDIDTNTVKAVGMIHGGVMSDGSCLAFHLGKALDELAKISGETFQL
ncbi:uncharacterized protein LOC123542879 [Mercenaria mercenaria]|uniref:uncharacterized protein LOC123542879 n=1 Tax=Mercenaria mercenaria TaxID=6596 RepID=UPI001E1D8766|nr:uncharacterized protein LOC123542879 [Mercenaria mercenaria]